MMNCRVHGMKLCKCRNERLYFNGKVNQTRSNEKKEMNQLVSLTSRAESVHRRKV